MKKRRDNRTSGQEGEGKPPPLSAGPTSSVQGLLQQRLIVCLGSGGVGKTTTGAALALAAAAQGRHTAVITVDPARRLKDALGLASISTDPSPVPLRFDAGRLDALALDTKRTFDALIARVAPTPEVADRIQHNRLYQELSNELGGSTEYMAMEKLYELLHANAYDLIVVDTPPSAHARDLLSAPLRMTALLASSAVRILKTPASLLWSGDSRLGRLTMSALIRVLERWTGLYLLRDLSEFASNFEPLVDGFRSRAHEVGEALRRADTSFVLVTTPEPDTVAVTIELDRELHREGFSVAGVIANRVYDFPPLGDDAGQSYPPALRRKLLAMYSDVTALAGRDQAALVRLQAETSAPLLASLPMLDESPVSFEGLSRFAAMLAPPEVKARLDQISPEG